MIELKPEKPTFRGRKPPYDLQKPSFSALEGGFRPSPDLNEVIETPRGPRVTSESVFLLRQADHLPPSTPRRRTPRPRTQLGALRNALDTGDSRTFQGPGRSNKKGHSKLRASSPTVELSHHETTPGRHPYTNKKRASHR